MTTLASASNIAILQKIFPQPTAVISSSADEVNGLPKNTTPQNCEILASGIATINPDNRQEHYLLSIDNAFVYLRICTAAKGSGYDEFAAVHGISELQKEQLADRAHRFINNCCFPSR